VAVLLIAVTVAVLVFRSCQNKPEAVVPIPSATVAQSAEAPNPKLDDIPLPPPPEEKPEAGPAPKIVYVQTGGGCETKCSGVSTDQLEQALQVRGTQARRCYNQALAQDSSLKGHVTITVKVSSNGNLCSANVTSNDMGSPSVANCAANIFRASAGYPAPRGGCIELGVPLAFIPQGQ
jgi:outer membrane biosynthesis protein TonB